jgi:starch-binding outer membrane protein, SusD/RagB family
MNIKHKIYQIMVAAALVAGTSSCEDFLTEEPVNALSPDNFWNSADDIRAGVAGVYDGLQGVYDQYFITWGDGRSDNFTQGGNGGWQIPLNNVPVNHGSANWAPIYTTINRANNAIKYIPTVKNVDPKLVNDALGQLYAIRAHCYFLLIRLWGDVPVWTEPYEEYSQSPYRARTPVAEVMSKVILPDLDKATKMLDPAAFDAYRVTMGAAYAMLTDVAMWNKDYPAALNWSDKLMKQGPNRYGLVAAGDWKALFLDPNGAGKKEAIFSLHWDWTVDGGASVANEIGAGNTNSDYSIENKVWDFWTLNLPGNVPGSDPAVPKTVFDIRGPQTTTMSNAARDKIVKYYPVAAPGTTQTYPSDAQADIRFSLYRYADILLLRAEALNKTGNRTGARTLLDQVHQRAGLGTTYNPAFYFPTQGTMATEAGLEEAILFERQLELFAESKRWFDLRRTDKVIEVMDPILRRRQAEEGLPITGFGHAGKILFPIHRDNLNANNLLVQNAPYTE